MVSTSFSRTSAAPLALALVLLAGSIASALGQGSAPELPPISRIPGVQTDVLQRGKVSVAPDDLLILSRRTYQPGAEVTWHRHASQVVFYILQGAMGVEERGRPSLSLKAGQSLLIMPGTIHRHWNPSRTQPLVFLEYVLVEKGRPSLEFVK